MLKEAIKRKVGPNRWCLYSKKKDKKTKKRRNLGCSRSKAGIDKREREVQTFKHAQELLDVLPESLRATAAMNYLRKVGEFLKTEDAGLVASIEVAKEALASISKRELRKWLEMTPSEARKLTPPKLYNILAAIIPEIEALQRQLEDLTYILDMCKDEKIVPLTKKYKSKVLQFREILVGAIQAPNVNVHAVLRILEKKHPELSRQINSIKRRQTTLVTRLVKTTTEKMESGNREKFPSAPPYEVLSTVKSLMKTAGMLDTVRLLFHKLGKGIAAVWDVVKRELSEVLDGLYDDIGTAIGVLSSMNSELEALL